MNLIYFAGMNCRIASLINIAALLGINYPDIFTGLWSETDFKDDAGYKIYTSKRIYGNLSAAGIVTEEKRDIEQIPDGEFFLAGGDIFGIPWHTLYKHFHDPHYFFARKEANNNIVCYDPIYDKQDIKINPDEIRDFLFEIGRVYKTSAKPSGYKLSAEAKAIIRETPKKKEKLICEIKNCLGEGRRAAHSIIKQITEMINCRRLFGCYLKNSQNRYANFFDDIFIQKWEGVKNGLYKVSIIQENQSIIEEVCDLLAEVLEYEINTARKIIENI